MPEPITPRVLVEIRHGCVKIFADPDVRIWFIDHDCFVDYDIEPCPQVPKEFRTLPLARLLPDSTTSDGGE